MATDRLTFYGTILASISLDALDSIVRVIHQMPAGRTVYVAGNGGSCTNAAHLVLHLREVGVRAIDLTADAAYLTATSNDVSYPEVFSHTLQSQATDRDCLLVISGSGDSPNILLALLKAKNLGMCTLGLLGFGGGMALGLCDVALVLESKDYGPVEVAHDACIHLIKEIVSAR